MTFTARRRWSTNTLVGFKSPWAMEVEARGGSVRLLRMPPVWAQKVIKPTQLSK